MEMNAIGAAKALLSTMSLDGFDVIGDQIANHLKKHSDVLKSIEHHFAPNENHYNSGDDYQKGVSLSPLDIICSKDFRGDFIRGNILKYLWRASSKGKYEADLKKAASYVELLVRGKGYDYDKFFKDVDNVGSVIEAIRDDMVLETSQNVRFDCICLLFKIMHRKAIFQQFENAGAIEYALTVVLYRTIEVLYDRISKGKREIILSNEIEKWK